MYQTRIKYKSKTYQRRILFVFDMTLTWLWYHAVLYLSHRSAGHWALPIKCNHWDCSALCNVPYFLKRLTVHTVPTARECMGPDSFYRYAAPDGAGPLQKTGPSFIHIKPAPTHRGKFGIKISKSRAGVKQEPQPTTNYRNGEIVWILNPGRSV